MIISLDNDTELQKFNVGDGNSVVFSSLNTFHHKILGTGFAIKYVHSGIEHYYLNNRHVPVKDNQYLLTNQSFNGKCEIESKAIVEGICINLDQNLIHEALASHIRPDTLLSDLALGEYFSSNMFLENLYNANSSILGNYLKIINNQKPYLEEVDIELFYKIAESIISDQLPYYRQLQSIPSLKNETKKEILRKMIYAKQLINDTATQTFTVTDYAKEVGISEYHFYRLFKKVYNISPKQLLIEKRLESAHKLLIAENLGVGEVASICGYADIFTFSKAFKKRFGIAPSSA